MNYHKNLDLWLPLYMGGSNIALGPHHITVMSSWVLAAPSEGYVLPVPKFPSGSLTYVSYLQVWPLLYDDRPNPEAHSPFPMEIDGFWQYWRDYLTSHSAAFELRWLHQHLELLWWNNRYFNKVHMHDEGGSPWDASQNKTCLPFR